MGVAKVEPECEDSAMGGWIEVVNQNYRITLGSYEIRFMTGNTSYEIDATGVW